MKKIFALLITISLLNIANISLADDADFWDEPIKIDTAAKNQEKAITDQEFEKVLKIFERKKKKKEDKKKPKGNPVWESSNPEQQNSISTVLKTTKDDYPTVMIPVTLITPQMTEIPPGFYRMLSAKNNEGYFINLYQGNSLIAKLKAIETGDDHNQKSLNYAKLIPINDSEMRIIYGDIDCNIETKLQIKE